ncbi:hypothetical protein V8F06_004387 [Rhypophila decipiens]
MVVQASHGQTKPPNRDLGTAPHIPPQGRDRLPGHILNALLCAITGPIDQRTSPVCPLYAHVDPRARVFPEFGVFEDWAFKGCANCVLIPGEACGCLLQAGLHASHRQLQTYSLPTHVKYLQEGQKLLQDPARLVRRFDKLAHRHSRIAIDRNEFYWHGREIPLSIMLSDNAIDFSKLGTEDELDIDEEDDSDLDLSEDDNEHELDSLEDGSKIESDSKMALPLFHLATGR